MATLGPGPGPGLNAPSRSTANPPYAARNAPPFTPAVAAANADAVLPRAGPVAGFGAATPPDTRMVKTGFDPAAYRLNLHLQSLISSGRLAQARALFDQMPHTKNAFSLNRMLSGYSRSGQLAAAHQLFLYSPPRLREAVPWTIMMAAFAAAPGRAADALALFRDMLREGVAPDRVTVSTVLNVPASGRGCIRL